MTVIITNVEGKGLSIIARVNHDDATPENVHKCDQCGLVKIDVDLWAVNDETGEEIRLCLTCGDR